MQITKFKQGIAYNKADSNKDLLGGKGHYLMVMASLGLPVPQGFIIPTTGCALFLKKHESYTALENEAVSAYYDSGLSDGLVSIRSGARVSMPGMCDTILNIGITDDNISSLVERVGEWTAWDCYRRLYEMYGAVVLGYNPQRFATIATKVMTFKYGCHTAPEDVRQSSVKHLKQLVCRYQHIMSLPQSPTVQLKEAIAAVFLSWNNPRAKEYRKTYGYDDAWGTAVVVQEMVFGNQNQESCSGVVFSHDPSTGQAGIMGEFLPNAQGEDVVAGTSNPLNLKDMDTWGHDSYLELVMATKTMESYLRDMVDIEFTVQDGVFYLLQARVGKRTPMAALNIARTLYDADIINKEEVYTRITLDDYYKAQVSCLGSVVPEATMTGTPASVGVVRGVAVWDKKDTGGFKDAILLAKDTCPDDFFAMKRSVAIVTALGGATSHAAVVARSMGKVCVVGCDLLDTEAQTIGGIKVSKGDALVVDGTTGNVWVDTGADSLPKILEGKEDTWLWDLEKDTNINVLFGAPTTVGAFHVPPVDICTIDLMPLLAIPSKVRVTIMQGMAKDLQDSAMKVTLLLRENTATETFLTGLLGSVPAPYTMKSFLADFNTIAWGTKINVYIDSTVDQEQISKDFVQLDKAATLSDIMTGGAVLITDAFVEDVCGGIAALHKLEGFLASTGVDIDHIGNPRTINAILSSRFQA